MISPEIPVPYVLVYSGEAVPQRPGFAEDPMSGMLRLSHRAPQPRSDWTRGVLLSGWVHIPPPPPSPRASDLKHQIRGPSHAEVVTVWLIAFEVSGGGSLLRVGPAAP